MDALTVKGLSKTYSSFTLQNISFQVPKGTIVGLVGENGAGKSTTINAVLGRIKKDSGDISILGRHDYEMTAADRELIGVVFDNSNFSGELSPKMLHKVLKDIYHTWDEALYFSLLEKMNLPRDKKIKTFSRGMKMKLSIIAAVSHHPRLLILDEATSGLDPVTRDDILDLFLTFVQEEENSILLSSHITSDLEKIADYIIFIHAGKLVFFKSKDELLADYGIIKCGLAQFGRIEKQDIIAYRKMDYEWQVLVGDRKKAEKKYPKAMIVPVTIDEIMLLYVKGET